MFGGGNTYFTKKKSIIWQIGNNNRKYFWIFLFWGFFNLEELMGRKGT